MHCVLAKKRLGEIDAILEDYPQDSSLFVCLFVYCLGLIKIHAGPYIKKLAKVLLMTIFQIYLILAPRNRASTDVSPPEECTVLSGY